MKEEVREQATPQLECHSRNTDSGGAMGMSVISAVRSWLGFGMRMYRMETAPREGCQILGHRGERDPGDPESGLEASGFP